MLARRRLLRLSWNISPMEISSVRSDSNGYHYLHHVYDMILLAVLHKKADKHPLSLVQRMRMARHCALGFSVLHNNGIMHRDVKSMNILVTEDYSCKITDFGCSKLIGQQAMLMTMGTGTLLWMAPEVKTGMRRDSEISPSTSAHISNNRPPIWVPCGYLQSWYCPVRDL